MQDLCYCKYAHEITENYHKQQQQCFIQQNRVRYKRKYNNHWPGDFTNVFLPKTHLLKLLVSFLD